MVALGLSFVAVAAPRLPAQVPDAQTLQRLLANPQAGEAIRQRLLQSGLTPEQIRQRLQAVGLPSTLLDRYLRGQEGAGLSVTDSTVQAMALLGLGTADQLAAFADSMRLAAFAERRVAAPEIGAGLRLFGLDLFRRATTQFLPDVAGPVDERYRLGPGDVLVLIVTGDVEMTHTLEVTREGFVLIPQVGQIYAANLTLDQLRRVLRDRLGRSYSGIRSGTTRFDVTVARVRMIQVYVTGEVAEPGSYQLPSVSTVLTALYLAGGPTERGNFRSVLVRRGMDTVTVLDLYEYLLSGAAAGDIRLETGDVVFVPVRGPRAAINGAVVRPAVYEIRPEETLADLVALAGDLLPQAETRRVTVHRIVQSHEGVPGPVSRVALDVPLAVPGPDGAARPLVPALPMRDGDSVVVDSLPSLGNTLVVRVTGMVRKPGVYPWRQGMTLRDLVMLARGPTVGADLREAELARLPGDRSGGRMAVTLRVPLDSSYLYERDSLGGYRGAAGVVFPAGGTAPEVVLEPFDQVTILRQPEFELQRTVQITGEVPFPGSYALISKAERVSELVARAGGLLPTAYAEGARFYRSLGSPGERERVNLALGRALAQRRGAEDVILQPGDSLDIPEYIPTVRVRGAVNSPSSVLYREGEGLDYYIANAGGYARNADRGRVSVRYANGSAEVRRRWLFFTSSPAPGPGSEVFVPWKPEGEPFNVTQFLAAAAQVLASTVAIIVIATR